MVKIIKKEGFKSSKPNLIEEQRKKRQTAAKRNARNLGNTGLEQTSLYCSKEFVLSDDIENQPLPQANEIIDSSKPPTMRQGKISQTPVLPVQTGLSTDPMWATQESLKIPNNMFSNFQSGPPSQNDKSPIDKKPIVPKPSVTMKVEESR